MSHQLPLLKPAKRILYFTHHSDHFEQWTIVDGRRVDLPDLMDPKSSTPGLCMTHWPTRRYVMFDEVIEQ